MKIVLEIGDEFAKKHNYSEYDFKMYAAVGFYREGLMSTGGLAEMVGIDRLKFIDEMHKYGAGILDTMTEEDLRIELENAKKFLGFEKNEI